jgi:membrane protein
VASLKQRASSRIAALRERRPFVDHLVRMQEHYGSSQASQQAGAVTYFGFLSFFPILALSFFVVGVVSQVYPEANANLRTAIDSVLPGFLGPPDGVSLADIRTFSGWAAVIGVLGVLYSGLGWLSALRIALVTVFEMPDKEQPNFVFGKLRDLATLATVGLVLIVAVALTGFVRGFSDKVLDLLHLGSQLGWLVVLVTVVFGLAANTVLFFALFKLLAEPHTPRRSLLQGALLGAVGFEALKQLSGVLLASTKDQPAFQAFGIALILLVWINYFTRVVLYAAAFAHTSAAARAQRVPEPPALPQGPPSPALAQRPAAPDDVRRAWAKPFAAGSATTLGLMALLRRRRHEE